MTITDRRGHPTDAEQPTEAMRPLRILIMAGYLPWHGHGGGMLVSNLLKQLHQHHDVTVLAPVSPGEEERVAEVAERCTSLITVPRVMGGSSHASRSSNADFHRISWLRHQWHRMPRPLRESIYAVRRVPYHLRQYRRDPWPDEVQRCLQPSFRQALRWALAKQRYDIVIAEWPEAAPYVNELPQSAGRVYESHELRSITYWRRLASAATPDEKLYWLTQWLKMKRLERFAMTSFDLVTAVSTREAALLRRYGGRARVVANPIGLDLTRWPRQDLQPRDPNTLIFLGRMSYTPNKDAVLFFLERIYPRIQAAQPDVRFLVIGGRPDEEILAWNGRDGVTVTGYVPDVRPYLEQGTVFVLPIRHGSGVKIKMLEAMAAGIPIVSTPEGCEGIEIEPGKHMEVATNEAEFATAVVRLLRDPGRRASIAEKARQVIWERYDSEKNVRELESLYWDIVRQRQQVNAP